MMMTSEWTTTFDHSDSHLSMTTTMANFSVLPRTPPRIACQRLPRSPHCHRHASCPSAAERTATVYSDLTFAVFSR